MSEIFLPVKKKGTIKKKIINNHHHNYNQSFSVKLMNYKIVKTKIILRISQVGNSKKINNQS